MKLVIDATNIKAGGGLTHLKRIIESYPFNDIKFELIGGDWLDAIENKNNILKRIFPAAFKSVLKQEFFKFFKLKSYLKNANIAFVPGGTFSSKSINYISMSQNMLVFENEERNRFPKSLTWLRYILLEKLQVRSFKNATGIIYISKYAKQYIEKKYPFLQSKRSTVIYHGISDDFRQKPKKQKSIDCYSKEKPFKLLYVSIINYYKHQWNLIEAVKALRKKGYNIELELIGPMFEALKSKMEEALKDSEDFINYKGKISYDYIASSYKNTDMFIFASTCENMPNILVEAMSAGLPILCSKYGPMPEILKDAGLFMDPTNIDSITENLEKLLIDIETRQEIAQKAYHYSLEFSWEKTAIETINFIKETAQQTHIL